jgi:hypothetical protein
MYCRRHFTTLPPRRTTELLPDSAPGIIFLDAMRRKIAGKADAQGQRLPRIEDAQPFVSQSYRAFTLCESEKGNAVMLVDIHT